MSVTQILTLADFVGAIQNRSKTGVVYSVSPNPGAATVGGPFTVLRNGVAQAQFIWTGVGVSGGPGWAAARMRILMLSS